MGKDDSKSKPLPLLDMYDPIADGDMFGKVRIWITIRDKRGRVIKGNKTRTITVKSTVGEVVRRIELALFREEIRR